MPDDFADVPITGRDRYRDDSGHGIEVGQRDVPFVQELGVRGTEGLTPFPVTAACPQEWVPQRTQAIPINHVVAEKGLQVFSRWSELDQEGEPLPETPRFNAVQLMKTPILRGVNQEDCTDRDPGWRSTDSTLWAVHVWGWEVARVTADPVRPLSEGVVLNDNIEVGNHFSRLKVRISMHGASGGTTRIIDIGAGIRFAAEAWQISVEILYPDPGTTQVQGNNSITYSGLVLDSVIGGFIAPTDSNPGPKATNTVTIRVPAGTTDARIFIPPGAKEVDLYQTGAGATFIPEFRLLRSVAPVPVGPSVGQIIFGGTRRVNDIAIPMNAGMITTGSADNGFDRVLTAVFREEI